LWFRRCNSIATDRNSQFSYNRYAVIPNDGHSVDPFDRNANHSIHGW
jgi:hypothetical protein